MATQQSILRDKIRKLMTQAVQQYNMIEPGDRVMVCVSGGKDSTLLLLLLQEMQQKAPFEFTIDPVLLDQKQPGFDPTLFKDWLQSQGFTLKIVHEDTYSIVKEKVAPKKSTCGLCSRLRRGILYNYAHKEGYSKIALGHHRDDLNETLLLNLFYNGRIASMPPKLLSDDERNTIIRPLALVSESLLLELAKEINFPVIPCNLCGSQENLQRQEMKKILSELEKTRPAVKQSLLRAQQNIRLSQLADPLHLS